jgi:hypothetical protein
MSWTTSSGATRSVGPWTECHRSTATCCASPSSSSCWAMCREPR